MFLSQTDPRDLRCYFQDTNGRKNVGSSIQKIKSGPLYILVCFIRANGSII